MKILVADDDPILLRLLERFLLKWNYEVVLARSGEEAWKILQREDAPKLAILDWMMPGMDGDQICAEVRKRKQQSYVYIVLLTANYQKENLIAGLDAGADDYLTKPFDANELRARLRTGRRVLELQEQLLSAYDRLKFRATHDPLTGVWNRAAVLEIVRNELARARRGASPVGILMADLDHFKQVNDTYGHLAGDEVLRCTTRRMRSSLRSYDSIGRYGGEEFLIVVPGCNLANALKRAEGLRDVVGSKPVDTSDGIVHVTMSLGVTVGGGDRTPEVESLLRAADAALYQAKNGGRNQVQVLPIDPKELSLVSPKPGPETIPVGG